MENLNRSGVGAYCTLHIAHCSFRAPGSGGLCAKKRAMGTERGCVEDQPQRVGSSKASGAYSVLRLVEDDTAALRANGGEVRVRGHANSNVSGSLLRLP